MRSSRAFGQALAAAVACVADDPPPPAGEDHGLVPQTYLAGQFDRPAKIGHVWLTITETPHVAKARAAWRATADRGRETFPLMQIALDAADRGRVRAAALTIRRDEHQRSPSMYSNTPPAERAPPATI